ncbi:MAG: response regulator [Phycisphaerales bacterium]|nr:response regulator [Phycisphaerales bacterium]
MKPLTPSSSSAGAPPEPTPGELSATETAPAFTPLRIVALDDDEDFRQYLASVLTSEGHEIKTVATPTDLYLAIDPHSTPSAAAGGASTPGAGTGASRIPDVVLLDIKMGQESGEDVLVELRQRWPKLCVIVVTGYPSLDSMRQTFKQDVFDYIAKPFSMNDLRQTLAQAATALGLGQRPQDRLRVELGRLIRLARTQRSWTLRDLSEQSGISVSQLSSIERGTHLPSLESLVEIATALEKQPSAWLAAAGL